MVSTMKQEEQKEIAKAAAPAASPNEEEEDDNFLLGIVRQRSKRVKVGDVAATSRRPSSSTTANPHNDQTAKSSGRRVLPQDMLKQDDDIREKIDNHGITEEADKRRLMVNQQADDELRTQAIQNDDDPFLCKTDGQHQKTNFCSNDDDAQGPSPRRRLAQQEEVNRQSTASSASNGIPGAFAFTPSRTDPQQQQQQQEEDDLSDIEANSTIDSDSSVGDLPMSTTAANDNTIPEAGLVTEENLTLAMPVDTTASKQRQGRRSHHGKLTARMPVIGLLAVGVILVVIAVVIVALVVPRTGTTSPLPGQVPSQEALSPSSSASSSSSPATDPTAAPSTSLDHLRTTLPGYTLESLQDPFSPQSKALAWLSQQDSSLIATFPLWRQTQLFALVTFFYAFEGPSWPSVIQNSWLDLTKGECNWYSNNFGTFSEEGDFQEGVTIFTGIDPCNEDGEFWDLAIGGLNLTNLQPRVPPEITLLSNMIYLHLFDNHIQGNIDTILPTEIYAMTSLLEIGLNGNQLTGTIPTQLGHVLANKRILDLSHNLLTGTIPTQLENLFTLKLFNNQLTGTLPLSLFPQDAQIDELELHDNFLTGTIPTQIGRLTAMVELGLGSNQFTGALPSQLGLFSHLLDLRLENLPALTGTIPSELWDLVRNDSLRSIQLSGSQLLSGFVPDDICWLSDPASTYDHPWFGIQNCSLEFECTDYLCGCDCPCLA